eukprot:CAMPEP_0185846538 /NCGR_PEP_ID=MMETSP1354-20130828/2133_1 /TAXON_ID=708628 /ORGANISM="Erythrolobus madagascarensis, Strain CCMP3276" /LENGTH=259 /DNA_ID=CAMNT_0028546677 /DNA_START=149 /DNA_END=928 /DNA_ORIENTATION=+
MESVGFEGLTRKRARDDDADAGLRENGFEHACKARKTQLPSFRELVAQLEAPCGGSRFGFHEQALGSSGELYENATRPAFRAENHIETEIAPARNDLSFSKEEAPSAQELATSLNSKTNSKSNDLKNSKYCHVCARKGAHIQLVRCTSYRQSTGSRRPKCRKAFCKKCLDNAAEAEAAQDAKEQIGISGYAAAASDPDWRCLHCTKRCPQNARCKKYTVAAAALRECEEKNADCVEKWAPLNQAPVHRVSSISLKSVRP